jgi:hypothetical protein
MQIPVKLVYPQAYSISEESFAYIFRSVLAEKYAKLNSGTYVSTDLLLERSASNDTRKRMLHAYCCIKT